MGTSNLYLANAASRMMRREFLKAAVMPPDPVRVLIAGEDFLDGPCVVRIGADGKAYKAGIVQEPDFDTPTIVREP